MITLEQVQEFLNIKSTEKDEWLESLITASAQMIQNFIGLDLSEQAATEVLIDGTGADFIRLPAPVSTITAITIDGTAVDVADFFVNLDYLEAYSDTFEFTKGKRNVAITANWGYSTWPDDLLVAQRMLVAWLYQKNKDEISVLSRSAQGAMTTFIQEIPPAILIMLQPYKASVM